MRNWLTQLQRLASSKLEEPMSQFWSQGQNVLQNQEELMAQFEDQQAEFSFT